LIDDVAFYRCVVRVLIAMLAVVRQIVDRFIANLVALVVEPCCGTFDIDIKVLWTEIGLLVVEWQENDAVPEPRATRWNSALPPSPLASPPLTT